MSSSRSLSPFDPCYLFCPAVFSLSPSVSLQGCNTAILSQADKACRHFSTAHFQSRVCVMDSVVSHRHERCCSLSCFFTIIVAVTMLPYSLDVTKHFLLTVISNSAWLSLLNVSLNSMFGFMDVSGWMEHSQVQSARCSNSGGILGFGFRTWNWIRIGCRQPSAVLHGPGWWKHHQSTSVGKSTTV